MAMVGDGFALFVLSHHGTRRMINGIIPGYVYLPMDFMYLSVLKWTTRGRMGF